MVNNQSFDMLNNSVSFKGWHFLGFLSNIDYKFSNSDDCKGLITKKDIKSKKKKF